MCGTKKKFSKRKKKARRRKIVKIVSDFKWLELGERKRQTLDRLAAWAGGRRVNCPRQIIAKDHPWSVDANGGQVPAIWLPASEIFLPSRCEKTWKNKKKKELKTEKRRKVEAVSVVEEWKWWKIAFLVFVARWNFSEKSLLWIAKLWTLLWVNFQYFFSRKANVAESVSLHCWISWNLVSGQKKKKSFHKRIFLLPSRLPSLFYNSEQEEKQAQSKFCAASNLVGRETRRIENLSKHISPDSLHKLCVLRPLRRATYRLRSCADGETKIGNLLPQINHSAKKERSARKSDISNQFCP